MAITVKAYSNGDDVLIAWEPDAWPAPWVGFQLERRDQETNLVTVINNRIPATANGGPLPDGGISSSLSPIRRCIWTDHGVTSSDQACYRVSAMVASGAGFKVDPAGISNWTAPVVVTGDFGDGLSAYFNKGTLMSQVVSKFVKGDVSPASLRQFTDGLSSAGNPARRYLSGEARSQILAFLADADRRGSSIYAAIYEINDDELIQALKPFGNRGHILIGNGGATRPTVGKELQDAGFEVHHRDLSGKGLSSPSVHNKFVVEVTSDGTPVRVLTGSTNWTTTGLCTQLNNAIFIARPAIAKRFRDQWDKLVAAGNDMPPALKTANAKSTKDGPVELYFAATPAQQEFKPVLDLIKGATQGVLFLMFTPGQSPLLTALLARARKNDVYVRGVVSSVSEKGNGIIEVGGQVVNAGTPVQSYNHSTLVPANVPPSNRPEWAMAEFNANEIHGAHMMAIVHSKTIVVDPFSPNCAVITGSHNFSPSASKSNDENLVIIRGDQALARAYAVHISGVYDAYAWRAFLDGGGDPTSLYTLAGWKPGGVKEQELKFWMA
ncbi:MAG: phospholipase D-like domain-containing protein [Caulobacteraceae bacterium]